MCTRTIVAILSISWFFISIRADEPSRHQPIDPRTIAACEKLRAQHGWFVVDEFGAVKFTWLKDDSAKLLPGFRFLALSDGSLAKMPPINVTFGLDLTLPPATDADLKQLKGLKNLTMLDLHFTKVTDVGLKELKDLQNLTALDLRGTKVTDAGLKELKDLKNLKTLNLSGTKVTDAGMKELKGLTNLTALGLESTHVTDAGMKELKDLPFATRRLEKLNAERFLDAGGPPVVLANVGPVADSEFKALVEQDARNIVALLSEAKIKRTADRSIKSNALMIAAYAQSRMGKNPVDDAKLARLRDTAIKVAATQRKKLAEAIGPAKTLRIDISAVYILNFNRFDLIAAMGVEVEELMYQFKKTAVGGLGIEDDIKANSKKATMKSEAIPALVQRILIVSDLCKNMAPLGGFKNPQTKRAWDRSIKDMQDAATALIPAANAKDAKTLQTAFTKLDASCISCHNIFK